MTAPLFDEYFNTEVYKLLWDFSLCRIESGNQQYDDKNLFNRLYHRFNASSQISNQLTNNTNKI
jgi:hypothetical protein